MVLATDDLFFFQRGTGMGNLRRTTIGDLNTDMQDTDVFMVQETTGMGNLRRTTWANRTALANTVMIAVGDVSNSNELRRTTWAAINDFLGINVTIFAADNNTATNENVTLDDLFTAAQLADTQNKNITIETGAIVGSTAVNTPAFLLDTDNQINGTITIINNGTIIGHGGDGSTTSGTDGGDGGPALRAGVDITIRNNGTISGGGGGGGFGGTGGNGTTTSRVSLGNGGSVSCCSESACQSIGMCSCSVPCRQTFGFADAFCASDCNQDCIDYSWEDGCSNASCTDCARNATTTTTGGTGGDGGNGQGYEQARTNGSAGSNGGTNAGAGGDGGDGGTAGNDGADGDAGANGTSTNGSAGSNGGAAGAAIERNCATVTIDVQGTINGENVDICNTATILSANNNTATNEEVTLDDLFTQAQIESTDALEITIETDAIVGSTDPNTPALSISSAFTIGGNVNVINNGTIIGAGGAENGGNGGAAFSTTVDVRFDNNGTISGGGGGGGQGGTGGGGSFSQQVFITSGCIRYTDQDGESDTENWCKAQGGDYCRNEEGCQGEDSSGDDYAGGICQNCQVTQTTNSNGGTGGAGGRGQGYNQTSQDGSTGANGGTNAGAGGEGGDGGAVGANGSNGDTGANGNRTNGSAGSTGGTAGNATTNNGNTILMDNDGTINGTQG